MLPPDLRNPPHVRRVYRRRHETHPAGSETTAVRPCRPPWRPATPVPGSGILLTIRCRRGSVNLIWPHLHRLNASPDDIAFALPALPSGHRCSPPVPFHGEISLGSADGPLRWRSERAPPLEAMLSIWPHSTRISVVMARGVNQEAAAASAAAGTCAHQRLPASMSALPGAPDKVIFVSAETEVLARPRAALQVVPATLTGGAEPGGLVRP